ncbi:MAG: hypothetical protein ACRDSE_12895, partial [Pseudonocardiaceae bacterium]
AVLLLALAVAAALAGTALARALGRVARHASRIAGLLLAGSGLYLVAYWMPSLLGGTSAAPADNPLTRAAADVTGWITAHQAPVVLVAGGVIAAGAGAAILATRLRRADRRPSGCCPPERAPARRLGHDARHPD